MKTRYLVSAVRKDYPQGGARQAWAYSLVEAHTWVARHDERHGGRHLYTITEQRLTGDGWTTVAQNFYTSKGVSIAEQDYATRVRG